MLKLLPFAAAALALGIGSIASAEGFEAMCMRVSDEWATQGDVVAQCACLADRASGDPALDEELRELGDTMSSDQEAYDAASDATKAALDACSVNG